MRTQSESQFSKNSVFPKNPKKKQGEGRFEHISLQSKEEMIERLRGLVADKNSTGSVLMANSRLNQGGDIKKFQQKFLKRSKEIQEVQKLTDKIK